MKATQLLRSFSTQNNKGPQKASEFKSFFRLRLQDRPIKLVSKLKEVYRTNKKVRTTLYYSKYFICMHPLPLIYLAFIVLYFVFPGTFLPGQYTARLMLVRARFSVVTLYTSLTEPAGSGEDFVKTI